MSAARQRRLHGLAVPDRAATVPPPATADGGRDAQQPQTAAAAPHKDATRGRGRSQAAPSRAAQAGGGKHRRAVTVPTGLVEQLRRRAQELDRYHTDLILDCLAATAADLEHAHEAQAPAAGSSPFARPRRQAHRGRTVTTLTLYLTRAEVDAMDALAGRLGLTRSGLVTRAIAHGLEHTA